MPGDRAGVTFRFLAEPSDVNFNGKVHGGSVLKWIDQAGYACAVSWSSRYCVTASIGGVEFLRPVLIGNLVTVSARVVTTGKTSMRIVVNVSARDLRTGDDMLTTSCAMVFVAMDDDGRPTSIEAFVPATEEDRRLADIALRIGTLSSELQAGMRLAYGNS